MRYDERISMKPGKYTFQVETTGEKVEIYIDRLLSRQGVTGLVYEGKMQSTGRKIIVKEFYPYTDRNVWGIVRNESEDQKLQIPGMLWCETEGSEFGSRFKQFQRGI